LIFASNYLSLKDITESRWASGMPDQMSQQVYARLTLWLWQRGRAKQLLMVIPLTAALGDVPKAWSAGMALLLFKQCKRMAETQSVWRQQEQT